MNSSTISKLPGFTGDGYGYGGGLIVICPKITTIGSGVKSASFDSAIALQLGEPGAEYELTAEFLRDAINEKLTRDYNNGGS